MARGVADNVRVPALGIGKIIDQCVKNKAGRNSPRRDATARVSGTGNKIKKDRAKGSIDEIEIIPDFEIGRYDKRRDFKELSAALGELKASTNAGYYENLP